MKKIIININEKIKTTCGKHDLSFRITVYERFEEFCNYEITFIFSSVMNKNVEFSSLSYFDAMRGAMNYIGLNMRCIEKKFKVKFDTGLDSLDDYLPIPPGQAEAWKN